MPPTIKRKKWVKKWTKEIQEARCLLRDHWDSDDWRATRATWDLARMSCCAAEGTLRAKRFVPDAFDWIDPAEPALLLQLISGWDLPGLSPHALRSSFRSEALLLTTAMGPPDTLGVRVSCATFIEYMLAQDESSDETDEEPIVAFDRDICYNVPEFSALYSVPDVPQLKFEDMSLDLLPPTTRVPLRYLLLGPARSGTDIHRDPPGTFAWNALAHGCKRWVFMSPDASDELALRQTPPEGMVWSIAEWFDQEWPKICKDAEQQGWLTYDFLQRAGEVVYTPVGWWHAVLNLEPSVAITHNVMSATVLQETIRSSTGKDGPGVVTEAMVDAVVETFGLTNHDDVVGKWIQKLLPTA